MSKLKEPLLAMMLSFVFQGLGQIYTGRLKRGILFLMGGILFYISGESGVMALLSL